MNYFNIALPIRIDKLYTYKSSEEISNGCRVVVSFNNTLHTGIVFEINDEPDPELKYKEILEIVDHSPIIPEDLMSLAKWISNYYQCSIGQSLFAMLPSAINIQIQQEIKKISDGVLPDSDGSSGVILNELSFAGWMDIAELREKVKINRFQYWLEKLEENGLIQIKRVYDARIKKKIANFVVLNTLKELPQLTTKQVEVYEKMKELGKEFPLSKIAKIYSYSIVKILQNKGILQIAVKELDAETDLIKQKRIPPKINLTDKQKEAAEKIIENLDKDEFRTFLLFGVTGSGKTEVYIKVIKHCLENNETALMLVPEISLTPQMVERFYNAFGAEIAILHSHLNDRERWEQWKKIKYGKSKIVIGARSAIFAPLKNIGVIIVDEEHENTYKQENTPRYHGRDVAVVRAKKSNAVAILGSATPSLESWQNVMKQKYSLLKLSRRPLGYKLPSVKIIDLKQEKNPKQLLSEELIKKIEEKLLKKQQIILLQNRRGHSSFVQCVACGKLFKCKKCDISLNYHSSNMTLLCHYCGHEINMPRKCTDCGNYMFSFGSPGTQQIEKQLQILFPLARILRMDSDSARKKKSYDSMFARMKKGNIDILLGTQMIAKGLDFANVTLVGVISADTGLNFPDFRAAEKTFQLLTQVAGRSGRGEKSGEVIIQTYNPEHYAIFHAMNQDFISFALKESSLRKTLHYPPFYRISRFIFSHRNEIFLKTQLVKNHKIIQKLQTLFEPGKLLILGPVPSPLVRLQNNYRYHIILKADSVSTMSKAVNFLKNNLKLSSIIKQSIDIDPYGLM
ncbi:MAG: primosomal protein N' [Armatimonadetes bacterium]|nr:primosomal protein N' [Armatimonadota bacterium]